MSRAKAVAAAGNPQRMLTLTTRPRPGLSLETAVRWLRQRFQVLLTNLRRQDYHIEYIAFIELHKSAWPHLHILTRGDYIPQRVLSAEWQTLTGSFKVYIQQVAKTWKGVQEATKYYLKTARQVHEACPQVPVYTKSKGWLPKDWTENDPLPGNYTFYAHCRLSWAALEDTLDILSIKLLPLPDQPRRFVLERAGPLDTKTVQHLYNIDDYALLDLVSALDLYFADPAYAHRDPALLKDRQDYAVAPHKRLQEAACAYDETDKAQMDPAIYARQAALL